MNTSQFMDKQIMDLSSSSQGKDFIDLMDPQDVHGVSTKKEESLPSYDFQPIRNSSTSQPYNIDSISNEGTKAWNSDDPNSIPSKLRNSHFLGSGEIAKISGVKDDSHAAFLDGIDGVMKKHADNLLHVLEGFGARLLNLESRMYQLEVSVEDLKGSMANSYGSTDGKMRQLENIMREVKDGLDIVKDKQEIIEAQLHLAKLKIHEAEQHVENTKSVPIDHHQPSTPQQQNLHVPPLGSSSPFPIPPGMPAPAVSSSFPIHPSVPTPVHLQPQFPSNVSQQEPYFPSLPSTHEIPNQHFPLPQPQVHPLYQAPAQQLQQSVAAGSLSQPSTVHHSEDSTPYNSFQNYPLPSSQNYHSSSQNYPPANQQSPSHPFTAGPPLQQFYSSPSDPYPEPPQYGGSSSKLNFSQHSSPTHANGGTGYPRLPTARTLPNMLPTASSISAASGSSQAGNRIPLDDVVEKVTNMGFSRDHVRATVQRLTENGQAVDLNVVLDSLTNGAELHPQKNWFGR